MRCACRWKGCASHYFARHCDASATETLFAGSRDALGTVFCATCAVAALRFGMPHYELRSPETFSPALFDALTRTPQAGAA